METLLSRFKKFKEAREIFYKKYNIKIDPAYDNVFGLDPVKLEVILDNRLLSSHPFLEMNLNQDKLDNMSVKEKCVLLFEDDDIESLKDLF